jgi:hypothetical protein
MKTLMMLGAAAATLASSTGLAEAQASRRCDERQGAPRISFDFLPRERYEVRRTETMLVGYRDEVIGYEDIWVERPVTVYETHTVYRSVFVGYDHCRRPIYRSMPVCEQVPVRHTQRVCEKRPIVEKRPVYETREVGNCERRPSPWGVSFFFGR